MGVEYKVVDKTGLIEFDLPDSKVNLLTAFVLQKLDGILDRVAAKQEIEALLFTSAKKDVFIAGADIKEIEDIVEAQDGVIKSKAGQRIFNKIEDLKIPTIAVIDGVALGGGCERSLACDYRIATFNEKVKIGLPEVGLGILPGFGGCYRLPKLIGLTNALKIILAGKVVSAAEALRYGMVDRLYPSIGLENSIKEFIAEIKDSSRRKKKFNRKLKPMDWFTDKFIFGQVLVIDQARRNVLKLTKGFYPAPLRALEVIRATYGQPREKALELEAKEFSRLAVGDVAKNLVKVFYLQEKYKKLKLSKEEGTEVVKPGVIKKCGVIGAGIMGGGIAQILAYKDIDVRMKDINQEAIATGLRSAGKVFQSLVKKRKLSIAQSRAKMARISGTTDWSGFKRVDCVIEAVVENMDIKKKVFKEVSQVVGPETLLFTNTSSLSIKEMGQAVTNPSRMLGFHFFNPVHRMPLIEIIITEETAASTINSALELVKKLGKIPILVKDSPGFLVNRILLAYINEAGHILDQDPGMSFTELDRMVTDFGLPMGPLSLSDEVGLDVGIKVLQILEKGFGKRFKPSARFLEIYEKKMLGRKSGKGFYLYGKKDGKGEKKENLDLIHQAAKEDKTTDRKYYLERMLYVMINEAARALEEGIVDSSDTVDVGMIMGTGFPAFRGGLLRYADSVGIKHIVEKLKFFANQHGPERFIPCRFLENLDLNKKMFYS